MVVLPTPPLGANTETTRVARRSPGRARSPCVTCAIRVIRSKPGERHRQDAVDAVLGVDVDRVLGHGQHDDRDAELGLVDLLDELGALDPALEQRVDEDDVRAQLGDLADRLAAVGQDVEQLDLGLRVRAGRGCTGRPAGRPRR